MKRRRRRFFAPSCLRFRHRPRRVRTRRDFARSLRLSPALEVLEDRVMLSVLLVNNGTDAHVANETSLREAVAQANTDAAAGTSDTIQFDPSLGNHTIQLTQGQFELSGAGAGVITIDGGTPSMPVIINPNGFFTGFRAFQIDADVQAVLENITIEGGDFEANGGAILNNGTLALNNDTLSSSFARGTSGGAIENQGTLSVSNTVFVGNTASVQGGAIDNAGTATVTDSAFSNNTSRGSAGAGAISNEGTLTLTNTTFTGNKAIIGGALENSGGTVTGDGDIFTNNGFENDGGALEISSGTVSLTNAVFTGNNAGFQGAAIDVEAGSLSLTNANLFANTFGEFAGAIYNNAGVVTIADSSLVNNIKSQGVVGGGGAVYNNSGQVTITNSTLAGNSVDSAVGGAIFNNTGSVILQNDTITGNHATGSAPGIDNVAGTLTIGNTIESGNTGGPADIVGVITTDEGHNLLATAYDNSTNDPTPGPGDVFSNAPSLAPWAITVARRRRWPPSRAAQPSAPATPARPAWPRPINAACRASSTAASTSAPSRLSPRLWSLRHSARRQMPASR